MIDTVLWTLIGAQMAMGAFDMLYHHEATERLAWRPSQATELRLHGIRNFFYGLIFLVFGWTEPHGVFTSALALVLIAEVLITLWDFVEEDRTRKLPVSERVTHALLALNYGAILAIAVPLLWRWAEQDTGLAFVEYGFWSLLTVPAAIVTAFFGYRDLAAGARAGRLVPADAGQLASGIKGRKHILITGGTGFIGQRLVEALVARNHTVSVLTRHKAHAENLPAPLRILTDLSQIPGDERIDCIVNLAGEPIANGLWTKWKRRRILESRLDVTNGLIRLIERLDTKPECLISGSAIGWYGSRDDCILDESASGRDCFGYRVCDAWEKAALKAKLSGVRVVCLRIGLVLGTQGGILSQLLTPFEFALGGPIGDGRQWMPWISLDDMVRLIVHGISDGRLEGPLNATAPKPVRNEDFTKALARALKRPAIFRVPAAPLRLALGDFADELLLGSKRVLPAKALASGFTFADPDIDSALAACLGGAQHDDGTRSSLVDRHAGAS